MDGITEALAKLWDDIYVWAPAGIASLIVGAIALAIIVYTFCVVMLPVAVIDISIKLSRVIAALNKQNKLIAESTDRLASIASRRSNDPPDSD